MANRRKRFCYFRIRHLRLKAHFQNYADTILVRIAWVRSSHTRLIGSCSMSVELHTAYMLSSYLDHHTSRISCLQHPKLVIPIRFTLIWTMSQRSPMRCVHSLRRNKVIHTQCVLRDSITVRISLGGVILRLTVSVALAYLYSAHALGNIRPENARGVLAAACLLGRMDDLCNYAYEICRQSISLDTLPVWLEFIETLSPPSDGSSTPVVEQHHHTRTAVFGPYAQRLRDDVFSFLVVTLPNLVNFGGQATPTTPLSEGASQQADAGRETLLQVFARVPFDLFKAAVESPTFHFGT